MDEADEMRRAHEGRLRTLFQGRLPECVIHGGVQSAKRFKNWAAKTRVVLGSSKYDAGQITILINEWMSMDMHKKWLDE